MSVINTRSFVRFWPVSWTITHRFGVPERFPRLTIPRVPLRVRRQTLTILANSDPLLVYYSPFWIPEAISIVVEPQGALTCRSSTLLVLADSGPFGGLLLTVLGSRIDFHD